ncbi:MAG: Cas10/Cmr2 second palm domain-containing protein [Promethearchaeota archaeon]
MDIISIQNYIFSSNQLKDNIGASYIVKNIFEQDLYNELENCFEEINRDQWEVAPDQIGILNNGVCEIGYVGGGNALLFFKDGEDANIFIKQFTKNVLIKYPGIRIAFGVLKDKFSFENFSSCMQALNKSLIMNKNKYIPNVNLQKYGFNLDCPRTNESAERFLDKEGRLISGVSYAKMRFEGKSLEVIENQTNDILGEKYKFSNDIEKFGQLREKSYVALVYIDGNNTGDRIKRCQTLGELRRISINLRQSIYNSFREMLRCLVRVMDNEILSKDNGFNFVNENGKTILPLRPILIGGDDISFISEGRLGLWLAEVFMENFIKGKIGNERISACGGIAIIKTKYPLYRAFRLAKYLLYKSKRFSRNKKDSSYLDYHISFAGWRGETFDENYYNALGGNLHFGPYRIDLDENAQIEENHIKNLREIINGLRGIPKNKIMQLKDILFESPFSVKMFIEKLNSIGYKLPEISGEEYHIYGWRNKRTPYFDAINLLDFYPEGLKCN